MTLDMLNLAIIPALAALGLWLEGLGGAKHGYVDQFFAPIPLAFAGYVFAMLGSAAP